MTIGLGSVKITGDWARALSEEWGRKLIGVI